VGAGNRRRCEPAVRAQGAGARTGTTAGGQSADRIGVGRGRSGGRPTIRPGLR
jgi:hypothetical protein